MAFRKHLTEQNINELYLNARFEITFMLLIITPYNLYVVVRFTKKILTHERSLQLKLDKQASLHHVARLRAKECEIIKNAPFPLFHTLTLL